MSSPGDVDLEVFARNHHRGIARCIETFHKSDDIAVTSLAALLPQRLTRLEHWPVVGLEYFEKVLRRSIAENEMTWLRHDCRCRSTEGRRQPILRAPDGRRLDCGRGWQVLADRLEQLANEALGCPVRQADPTAGPGHTHHFGGSAVLVGTEHCAEGRNHGVEGRTRKRQVLGVGNLELDLKPFRL